MGLAPGDPFGEQNAPHLTALDLDPVLLGGLGQGIQRPMRRFLLLGFILGSQAAIGLQHEPPRREQGDQGHQRATFLFADAPFAPRPGPIAQPIESAGVEREQSFAHGLLVAEKLSGDGAGAEPLPTEDDHLGPADPIGGGMTAPSQLADLALFERILRWTRKE